MQGWGYGSKILDASRLLGHFTTSKVKGASEEKIRRSYEAIALYNDTVATGDDDRLVITNQALRELSGVNGLLVGGWIKAHVYDLRSQCQKLRSILATGKPPSLFSVDLKNSVIRRT